MRRRIYTLDVFTRKAHEGNPLAVVTDGDGLSTARMQAIARELSSLSDDRRSEIARAVAKRDSSGFAKTVERALDRLSEPARVPSPPTMPARHWARTSRGCETMNIGAPITGRARVFFSDSGKDMAAVDASRRCSE